MAMKIKLPLKLLTRIISKRYEDGNKYGYFYRERQLAKERAERERQDMEKRKQKDLELKQKMEKIKELVNTSVDHF